MVNIVVNYDLKYELIRNRSELCQIKVNDLINGSLCLLVEIKGDGEFRIKYRLK